MIPSKFQRQVGQVRLAARNQGFVTSAVVLPDLDADASERVTAGGKKKDSSKLSTVYLLPFEEKAQNAPIWQLLKSRKSQVPLHGWLLNNDALLNVDLTDQLYWRRVSEVINDMPLLCRSVEVNSRGVSWIGEEDRELVENEQFMAQLADSLFELRQLNLEIHDRNSTDELE